MYLNYHSKIATHRETDSTNPPHEIELNRLQDFSISTNLTSYLVDIRWTINRLTRTSLRNNQKIFHTNLFLISMIEPDTPFDDTPLRFISTLEWTSRLNYRSQLRFPPIIIEVRNTSPSIGSGSHATFHKSCLDKDNFYLDFRL